MSKDEIGKLRDDVIDALDRLVKHAQDLAVLGVRKPSPWQLAQAAVALSEQGLSGSEIATRMGFKYKAEPNQYLRIMRKCHPILLEEFRKGEDPHANVATLIRLAALPHREQLAEWHRLHRRK